MTFSEQLNGYLRLLDARYSTLAKASGLSVSAVSNYVKGEREPAYDSEQTEKLIRGIMTLSKEREVDLIEEKVREAQVKTPAIIVTGTVVGPGVHVLAGVDPVAQSALVHQLGEHVLDLLGVPDVLDVKVVHGGVRTVTVDGARADDPLPEAALQGDIRDPIEAHLILGGVEDTGVDVEPILIQPVYGEGPGQTQEIALPILPEIDLFGNLCLFCHCVSLPPLFYPV